MTKPLASGGYTRICGNREKAILGNDQGQPERNRATVFATGIAACLLLVALGSYITLGTDSIVTFCSIHNRISSCLFAKTDQCFGSGLSSKRRSNANQVRSLEDEEAGEANEAENDDINEKEQNAGDDFFDDVLQDDLIGESKREINHYYAYDDDDRPEKPVLFPLQAQTVVGYFVAALALGLGASSGTGGGGTIVPIYILIMQMPINLAIPIGAVTVLGGALASTCFNAARRHPLADRVLIDWDFVLVRCAMHRPCLPAIARTQHGRPTEPPQLLFSQTTNLTFALQVMEPLTLVGTLLGTLLHRVVSVKILMVVLILLLSLTAYTTLSKAMRMFQAEVKYIRHLRAAQSEPPLGMSPSSISKSDTWGATSESEHLSGRPPSRRERQLDAAEKQAILILNPDFVTLRSELMEQEKFTPRSKIIALCGMFSVLIFLNIMVGGGGYNSPWGIKCGSEAFWVMHVIMIAFLIASAWAAHSYVVARFEIKQLVRFDYVHGDIKWDTRSAIIYPAVFMAAGLFAGTLGIGGGSKSNRACLYPTCHMSQHLTPCFAVKLLRFPSCWPWEFIQVSSAQRRQQ
jgi:uncharacterized membrane protein YfcA